MAQLQLPEEDQYVQNHIDKEEQHQYDVGIQLDPTALEDNQQQESVPVANWHPIIELKNVGFNDKDIEKLQALGCHTIEQTLQHPDRAITATGITDTKLKQLRKFCLDALPSAGFVSGRELGAARSHMLYISTGSHALDTILGGGIEPGAITELYGEFNTGKSQLCHSLAVTAQLPRELGGASGRVLYIDTEGTFRPERIVEIADSHGLDSNATLDNIQVARALSSDHQKELLKQCGELMAVDRYALIIVDSVTALFRTDYAGRGSLSERQVALGRFLRDLHGLAHTFGVAAVITNQVVSDIAGAAQMGNGMDNKKPIGGNILAHASTVRIQFRKHRNGKLAKIVDSPSLAEAEARFTISTIGICDVDDAE